MVPKRSKNGNFHITFSPICAVGLGILGVIHGNLGYFQKSLFEKNKQKKLHFAPKNYILIFGVFGGEF